MPAKKKSNVTKYVFISVFLLMIFFSFLIIRPYLNAILGGIVLAMIFYPIYNLINRKIKNKNLAALIVTTIAILIVFLPIFFVFQQISYQTKTAYIVTKQKLVGGQLVAEGVCEGQQNLMCKLNDNFKRLISEPSFIYQRDRAFQYIEDFIWKMTPNIIFAIPKIIINLFLLVFVLFYSLKEGEGLFERINEMLPLKKEHKKKITYQKSLPEIRLRFIKKSKRERRKEFRCLRVLF